MFGGKPERQNTSSALRQNNAGGISRQRVMSGKLNPSIFEVDRMI